MRTVVLRYVWVHSTASTGQYSCMDRQVPVRLTRCSATLATTSKTESICKRFNRMRDTQRHSTSSTQASLFWVNHRKIRATPCWEIQALNGILLLRKRVFSNWTRTMLLYSRQRLVSRCINRAFQRDMALSSSLEFRKSRAPWAIRWRFHPCL